MLVMASMALAGCAGADGVFDRYTLGEAEPQPPIASDAPTRQPGGIEAGRYAGETKLIAQSGACPPDTGVLTVSQGALRYSDSANGMIDGMVGSGGRVDIRRGSIELQGRLVASRFTGTVSGGRCAYELALRHGGVSTPSSLGLSYAVASATPFRGAIAVPPAAAAAPPDDDASPDAEYSRQARFAALLARLRASRTLRHSAPDEASAPVTSQTLPSPADSASVAAAGAPAGASAATPAPAASTPGTAPVASASSVPPQPAADPLPSAGALAAKSSMAQAYDPQSPIDLTPAGPAHASQHPAVAAGEATTPTASPAQQAGQLLAQGRIAAARPLYERAAASGDAAAATAVGKTYDPLFLADMHASEVQPDPKLAEAWYRRGAELGDPRASSRLSSLQAMQQQ